MSDISLGVGVVALGAALWVYLARPAKTEAQVGWSVRPAPGGAAVALTF